MKPWVLALTALLTLACMGTPADTGDTAPEAQDTDDPWEPPDQCEELLIDPIGPEPPHVDDSWVVWLRCDGATLIGWTVLRFDPPDFANVSGNEVSFRHAGTAEMTIQVGTERASRSVTVEP